MTSNTKDDIDQISNSIMEAKLTMAKSIDSTASVEIVSKTSSKDKLPKEEKMVQTKKAPAMSI